MQMLEDAQKLPAAYRAMDTRTQTYKDTTSGTTVSGWEVCQYIYKMNEDGDEWWSNDFRLFVDGSGSLWNVELGEQYESYSTPARTSHVHLEKVDAEKLRMWHTNGWDFAKMKSSIEAMI
jgi:hypothetical protein